MLSETVKGGIMLRLTLELQKETLNEDQLANSVEDKPTQRSERAVNEGGVEVKVESDPESGNSDDGMWRLVGPHRLVCNEWRPPVFQHLLSGQSWH